MLPPTRLHILAVDDEPTILEVLSACLRSAGHSVETCSSAPAALERFLAEDWDVVITDRLMPGMDGIELSSAIKRISADTPVIMMTGLTAAVCLGDELPIDAVLAKPFTMASLRQTLASVSDARQNFPAAPVVFN